MYRISDEAIQAAQVKYKKQYKPFRPFSPREESNKKVCDHFFNLVKTQNGQDTDDYCILDNNKVEKYLSFLPRESKVLILGTGTGREVLVAKDLGLKAVGVTLGSRNVDYGVEQLGLGQNELIEALNEDLPFPSESFDCIAGFQVFEHTIAPLVFLLEQRRVLKNGGKLVLEWPPADKFSMEDNPHHQVCFTPGQAKALLQKAEFSNIHVRYDDLKEVEETDYWRGDQDKMLVIEGTKSPARKDYVHRSNKF